MMHLLFGETGRPGDTMATLSPLKTYAPPSYPKAAGTMVGKILVAASVAATSRLPAEPT